MEYIVFKALGILGALVLVAMYVMIIWSGILKLKDFILERKHGKRFLYELGRAEGIYKACEILYQYIDWYDCPIKCVGGCVNRDCSKDLAEYVLEQLKEKQNEHNV